MLVLAVPGQLFRNYMAFLVMLNMALFLKAFLLPCKNKIERLLWMTVSGAALGLTFLVRIDLGFFLSIIFLGLALLSPWIKDFPAQSEKKVSFCSRALWTLAGLALAIVAAVALHIPVYKDAVHRSFSTPFLQQYQQYPHMVLAQERNLLNFLKKSPDSKVDQTTTPVEAAPVVTSKTTEALQAQEKTTLARRSFKAHKMSERLMALNLYFPILLSFLLMVMAGSYLFSSQHKVLSRTKNDLQASSLNHQRLSPSLLLLTCLGCSLTLFPQYFFWRPDMVHLSEFMVPMSTTTLIATIFALDAYKKAGRLSRIFIILFCFSSIAGLLLYYNNGFQSQSTGGIAISQHRTVEFSGANGVHVKLTPQEFQEASAIYQSVIQHSKPGEYVICYPYNPEINFMTNRPSYRHNLYIDDLTAPDDFDLITQEEIEKYHPAVIVITDWPINGTEHSRFTHWAAGAYEYIRSHYVADYEQGIIHVFVRPEPTIQMLPTATLEAH
jgi:hypothetical protein